MPVAVHPARSGTSLRYRSGRGPGSLTVGRLVAEELIEVAAVGHLAEPGQCTQPHEPLAYLTQSGIHRVLLGLSTKDLSGKRQRVLVNFYWRLHHDHVLVLPSIVIGYHGYLTSTSLMSTAHLEQTSRRDSLKDVAASLTGSLAERRTG